MPHSTCLAHHKYSPWQLPQQLLQHLWQQPLLVPAPQPVHVTQRPAGQVELPELPQHLEPQLLPLPLQLPSVPYQPCSESLSVS